MQYFRELLKNIDFTLLLVLLFFAVISVTTLSSTSYEGGFLLTRSMKIQILAYCLGLGLLFLVLF